MNQEPLFEAADFEANKVYGILAYVPFLFFIGLITSPQSAYTKFHANQGLVYSILVGILSLGTGILKFIFRLILPFFLEAIFTTIFGLIALVPTVTFLIIGIINATSGAEKKLPIIGEITLLK